MRALSGPLIAVFSAIALLSSGCTLITPVDRQMHDTAFAFVSAYESKEFASAFALLTKDAQSKIDQEIFSSTAGDFRGVVEAFSEAGITTRNNPSKNEPSIYVEKLRGRKGVLTFVMVPDGAEWRIANVVEGSTQDASNNEH